MSRTSRLGSRLALAARRQPMPRAQPGALRRARTARRRRRTRVRHCPGQRRARRPRLGRAGGGRGARARRPTDRVPAARRVRPHRDAARGGTAMSELGNVPATTQAAHPEPALPATAPATRTPGRAPALSVPPATAATPSCAPRRVAATPFGRGTATADHDSPGTRARQSRGPCAAARLPNEARSRRWACG